MSEDTLLSESLTSTLDWQKSGNLEYANSPFGFLLRSKDGLWLLNQKCFTQLVLNDDGQYLSVENDGSKIGLMPIDFGYLDKVIFWLIGPSFHLKDAFIGLVDCKKLENSKVDLNRRFDDGDITTKEFLSELDSLMLQKADVLVKQMEVNRAMARAVVTRKKLVVVFFVILVLGIFIGFSARPWFSGFSTAEQCAIEAKTKAGVAACYSLYPSVDRF